MDTNKIKTQVVAAIGGAIAFLVIPVLLFGWFVTAGSAEKLAKERSAGAVTAALTPYCVAAAQADPDFGERLEAIKAQSNANTNRDSVERFGWATAPNSTSPNRPVAVSCVAALRALN